MHNINICYLFIICSNVIWVFFLSFLIFLTKAHIALHCLSSVCFYDSEEQFKDDSSIYHGLQSSTKIEVLIALQTDKTLAIDTKIGLCPQCSIAKGNVIASSLQQQSLANVLTKMSNKEDVVVNFKALCLVLGSLNSQPSPKTEYSASNWLMKTDNKQDYK